MWPARWQRGPMHQLGLPLDLPAAEPPKKRPSGRKKRVNFADGQRSFEEKEVQVQSDAALLTSTRPRLPTDVVGALAGPRAAARPWPAALTWDDALAYTSLSEVELRRGVRRGIVQFRCVGRRGCRVAARDQLDRLIAAVFGPAHVGIEEDFDFG